MSTVRMLKCTLVARQRDADGILEALQDAGLLHVVSLPVPEALLDEAEPITELDGEALKTYEMLDERRRALVAIAPAPARLQEHAKPYAEVLVHIDELVARRASLSEQLEAVTAQIAALAPFGDIEPAELDALRAHGLDVAFATFQREDWDALESATRAGSSPLAWVVSRAEGDDIWVMFVGKDLSELHVPRIELPDARLSILEAKRDGLEADLGAIQRDLSRYAHYEALIAKHMEALSDRVELLRAKQRTFSLGPLFALEGYVPAENAKDLEAALGGQAVVLRFSDPESQDPVPVLLKNNWFVRGFEDLVRRFSGVSYWEKDFSWAVGILFIVFGALCLLDAGYGLLLSLTGVWLARSSSPAFGKVLAITGAGTLVLGLLSGQVFGLVVGQHIMKDAAPPLTLAQVPLHAFYFSLVVGVAAMLFSFSLAIWQRGFKTPATGGLLLVLGAATYIASNPAGEYLLTLSYRWQPPPTQLVAAVATGGAHLTKALISVALLAFVLFPDPVFGPKARAGNIVWTLYASITGVLQDVLSHMRLFGIALSGSIMALLVNDLGGRLPLAATVIFAIIGHGLVYLLSLLSLYVHANRLIFLEFGSKCIDGGHHEYQPLRRRSLA